MSCLTTLLHAKISVRDRRLHETIRSTGAVTIRGWEGGGELIGETAVPFMEWPETEAGQAMALRNVLQGSHFRLVAVLPRHFPGRSVGNKRNTSPQTRHEPTIPGHKCCICVTSGLSR